MNTNRPDFISIRLSDGALKQLGDDAQVRVVNGHYNYLFKGSLPVEILRAGEWSFLRHEVVSGGVPMFQEADAPASNDSHFSEA